MTDDDPIEDAIDHLEALEEMEQSEEKQRRIQKAIRSVKKVPGAPGKAIRGFDRRDAAEALVGSVLFGIPMIAESGSFEIGTFLAQYPMYYLGTVVFGIAVVTGMLYATDFRDVEVVNPILGVIPRRPAALLTIAAITSLVLTTAWGRVDWTDPWTATAKATFIAVAMAFGAAISDLLPSN